MKVISPTRMSPFGMILRQYLHLLRLLFATSAIRRRRLRRFSFSNTTIFTPFADRITGCSLIRTFKGLDLMISLDVILDFFLLLTRNPRIGFNFLCPLRLVFPLPPAAAAAAAAVSLLLVGAGAFACSSQALPAVPFAHYTADWQCP